MKNFKTTPKAPSNRRAIFALATFTIVMTCATTAIPAYAATSTDFGVSVASAQSTFAPSFTSSPSDIVTPTSEATLVSEETTASNESSSTVDADSPDEAPAVSAPKTEAGTPATVEAAETPAAVTPAAPVATPVVPTTQAPVAVEPVASTPPRVQPVTATPDLPKVVLPKGYSTQIGDFDIDRTSYAVYPDGRVACGMYREIMWTTGTYGDACWAWWKWDGKAIVDN